MTTINGTITDISGSLGNRTVVKSTWFEMALNDEGAAMKMTEWADRSVQVVGTFGAGGTVVIEGSLDGTNFATLSDPQGNALTIQTAKIEAITELVQFIRPRVTGGDGTTSLTVTIMCRRTK